MAHEAYYYSIACLRYLAYMLNAIVFTSFIEILVFIGALLSSHCNST